MSAEEKYAAISEEMAAPKTELQVLNRDLQDALSAERAMRNDLQNALNSTEVAALYLDLDLRIWFFTSSVKPIVDLRREDVGRPVSDFHAFDPDGTLGAEAGAVLQALEPVEREIEAEGGRWLLRRILPYRTEVLRVEGVVITFADVTERKRALLALAAAKRQAELATIAKSRFLAAASHELRQPLQTLSLMQNVLIRKIQGHKMNEALELAERLGETTAAMSSMLTALLDIRQLETGTIRTEQVVFRLNDLLSRLMEEFAFHAEENKLSFRAVPCTLWVRSDPRLLEQMIRNLFSNALKYTENGRILVGCRRHGEMVSIEVWDTGIGIPEAEISEIFEEYYQVNNAARQTGRGLGLGLSILQRLAELLGHRIQVRSKAGKGSMFAIEVGRASPPAEAEEQRRLHEANAEDAQPPRRAATILVVEDEPDEGELLKYLLEEEGYYAALAGDGTLAFGLVQDRAIEPDLILADFNLPGQMNGLELITKLRQHFRKEFPAVLLTGDVSTGSAPSIELEKCVRLTKPAKAPELMRTIQRLLPTSQLVASLKHPPWTKVSTDQGERPVVFVVDDDPGVRQALCALLEEEGLAVEAYATCGAFLEAYRPRREACLLLDAYMPAISGLDLLRRFKVENPSLPAVMITGRSDVPIAVQAMKAGAMDFIEKPVGRVELLESVRRALAQSRDLSRRQAARQMAADRVARLTGRQRQIMELVLAGHPNKNIAADLRISQRTVENHRAMIMRKMGVRSVPALARLALVAQSLQGSDDAPASGP